MQRRIIEIVRIAQDLPHMLPRDALDPPIADDVLRIVDSEETKMEVARVQRRRRHNAQESDRGIYLPRAC